MDGVEHLPTRFGAHVGMIVERTRDGAYGNIAIGCDVLDGRHGLLLVPLETAGSETLLETLLETIPKE
jgi:hypothetical protein